MALQPMNPPARSAHNELKGRKDPSSVLVRGFSALEIAKQAGLVPAHWTEVQFTAWLRLPATEAAQEAMEAIATVNSSANIILNQLRTDSNNQLAQHYAATQLYLQQIGDLIEAGVEGELTLAELQVITDMLALRNFGSQEVIATGAEQFLPLPIQGLVRRNVHVHWNGVLQPHENHTVEDNAVYFTAPEGVRVLVTIS